MNRILISTAALAALAGAHAAQAQTVTTSIAASASVSTVCEVSATGLNFGEVALTGVTNGTASVTATCTNGGAYDIGLSNGTNAVGTQRTLISGENSLNYDLFSDATRNDRWGNIVGTDTVPGIGDGDAQELTIYGQIAAAQTVNSGNGVAYGDSIEVTITF